MGALIQPPQRQRSTTLSGTAARERASAGAAARHACACRVKLTRRGYPEGTRPSTLHGSEGRSFRFLSSLRHASPPTLPLISLAEKPYVFPR